MQTEGQRAASRSVNNWLASRARSNAWLVKQSGADKGTVGTFLAGETWPRRTTLARIEDVLGWPVGTITDIAEGRAHPPLDTEPPAPSDLSTQQLLAEIARRLGLNVTIDDDPADQERPSPPR